MYNTPSFASNYFPPMGLKSGGGGDVSTLPPTTSIRIYCTRTSNSKGNTSFIHILMHAVVLVQWVWQQYRHVTMPVDQNKFTQNKIAWQQF